MCELAHLSRLADLPDPEGEPEGPYCNIYHVHQNGSVFYEPNVLSSDGEVKTGTFCGEDRLVLVFVFEPALQPLYCTF